MKKQEFDISISAPASVPVEVRQAETVGLSVSGAKEMDVSFIDADAVEHDYTNMINKPSVNGVTLEGDLTLSDLKIVSENTSDGWDKNRFYVPKSGEVCVYTDIHKLKIGDGSVPIVDLPFIEGTDEGSVMEKLNEHVTNTSVHVSDSDRLKWDKTLVCQVENEQLVFSST